ncbi:50S ribosomal protein L33 [Candidatus Proelusimicrobium volucris]|uniref:50S ribosomal protein L33 n=1 Tax=Candidatus Proelusimicrobium volucris TaxID=3416225 RepID=UPI003D116A16
MATAERLTFVLSCTECKNKNYYFAKGKKKDYKVELNKFCKKCGKQTLHKEGKASK